MICPFLFGKPAPVFAVSISAAHKDRAATGKYMDFFKILFELI